MVTPEIIEGELRLPPATLQKLQQLYMQQQAIQAQVKDITETALDVLGLQGGYMVDISTGILTKREQPTPVPMNRAQRRKAKDGHAT